MYCPKLRPLYTRERPGTHCGEIRCAAGPVCTGSAHLAPTGIRSPDRPGIVSQYADYPIPAHHGLSTTCVRFLSSGDTTERSEMANYTSSLNWIVSLPFRPIFYAVLLSSSAPICRNDCNCNLMITQVFLGFPVSISKCWDGSCVSKLPLRASHLALPI
jgi:hypothetical protein